MVSYQYLNTLAEPNTTISSPVVSYQYFDWPGDENLTFQTSPNVSYYFSGGVSLTYQGSVRTSSGAPVAGATLMLRRYGTIFWQGVTDANGNYTAPNLPAANYHLTVAKAGFQTLEQNVAGFAGGNGGLQISLAPLPPNNPTQQVNRNPQLSALGTTSSGSRLLAFNGSTLTSNFQLDANRPTVVLAHGWLSKPAEWAAELARLIHDRTTLTPKPNIVVWDWETAAGAGLLSQRGAGQYVSLAGKIDVAAIEGTKLGEVLQQAFGGVTYGQRLHFIGHSFGTIVNRYACDYLHASFPADRSTLNTLNPWPAALTRPHVTLLDEAELANALGTNVITSTAVAAQLSVNESVAASAVQGASIGLKKPIPKEARWIDNYISLVGLQHAQAVNICLTGAVETTLNPVTAHAWAHQWYRQSADRSGAFPAALPGFARSFESAGYFPPTGTGLTPGSLWLENTATPDPLDLTRDPDPVFGEATTRIAKAYTLQLGRKVEAGVTSVAVQTGEAVRDGLIVVGDATLSTLDATGRAVLTGYETGIKAAGEIGGTVIYTSGQVIAETREKTGELLDAARDHLVNAVGALEPDVVQIGPVTIPFIRIRLQRGGGANLRVAGVAAASAPATPPYAWMTVHVPENAAYLAFDFTVTGQPADDRIVCAINEQNVFNLPAKYAPDGVPSSTDLIDVSAFAGQDIELFFGLAGGTSTNCEVAIDGVRFITVPQPKIGIADAGPNVLLKWPAAATGWIVETSDTLAPDSWLPVPMTSATVERGVATLEQPVSGAQRFYRLRRN